MSKKKGEEEVKKGVFFGRPGNNVSIGIVGMPNVGKSTMFNALSGLNVPAENYPFCTINPNTARVAVPDDRFDFLVDFWKPKSVVSAVLSITDIAGLVKGAHEGKGLGNEFLTNISQVDAIFHLVRAFKSKEIEHVEGSVDPIRDLEIITEELVQKDLKGLRNRLEVVQRMIQKGIDKTKKADEALITKVIAALEEKKDIRYLEWDGKEMEILNELQLLSAKPVVYLVNVSLKNFEEGKNEWIKGIKEWVNKRSPGTAVIPFSAAFEGHVLAMPAEDRVKFLAEKKVPSMINKIITTGYHALDLIHFFTCGEDEVRAWTLRKGCTAPGAGGVIHSDFEKGFIAAETMAYVDFKACGSEAEVKKAGKYRTEGKAYIVKDGDILYFKAGQIDKGNKKAAGAKK
jgi:obg-like ATPase 1